METVDISTIKNLIQDTHVNFLVGSGASRPFLATLNNIETLSDEVRKICSDENTLKVVDASLHASFFNEVIKKNMATDGDAGADITIGNYENFLSNLNHLISDNKNPLIAKQVNLFTTNVDTLIEHAADKSGVELNDGFKGRLSASYRLDNFRTRLFKLTLHYDNSAEVPVFNLLKIHGSLTWKIAEDDKITFNKDLVTVENAGKALAAVDAANLIEIKKEITPQQLIDAASILPITAELNTFEETYGELAIVNPSKDKFKRTVMQQAFYDLLRQYSNELEREATSLFVIGFSFADEHIRALTIRAANTNPTLVVYVFCHTEDTKSEIKELFKNENFIYGNIKFIAPEDIEDEGVDIEKLNLESISKSIFSPLSMAISNHKKEDAKEDDKS